MDTPLQSLVKGRYLAAILAALSGSGLAIDSATGWINSTAALLLAITSLLSAIIAFVSKQRELKRMIRND